LVSLADLGVYAGLFAAAFLAATLFPAQSEIGLAALVVGGTHTALILVIIASIGNTLGAVVNWMIGRGIERFQDRRWFPASAAQMDRATIWYRKYGRWSLLLSWVPIIGDPLTLVAGVLREPLPSFVLLAFVAKTTRYVVIAALAAAWV